MVWGGGCPCQRGKVNPPGKLQKRLQPHQNWHNFPLNPQPTPILTLGKILYRPHWLHYLSYDGRSEDDVFSDLNMFTVKIYWDVQKVEQNFQLSFQWVQPYYKLCNTPDCGLLSLLKEKKITWIYFRVWLYFTKYNIFWHDFYCGGIKLPLIWYKCCLHNKLKEIKVLPDPLPVTDSWIKPMLFQTQNILYIVKYKPTLTSSLR